MAKKLESLAKRYGSDNNGNHNTSSSGTAATADVNLVATAPKQ
jgi:hypothetical protein